MILWYSGEWMVSWLQEISSGNESHSWKEKMVKSLKWVFEILDIRLQLKKIIKIIMEQLKAEIFPSCLLNKSLKVKKWWKKSNITFSKGPIFQFRYSLHQQHMILTKCTHFISRYFLDMMHDRLNCQTVLVTLLIIAHRRLLFDKFRELSSFYRTSIFFKENARNWFGSYQCVRESVNKKICVKITPNAWILTGLQHVHQQLIQ